MSPSRKVSGVSGLSSIATPLKHIACSDDAEEHERVRTTLLQNPAVGRESAIVDRLLSSGDAVSFRKGDKIIEQGAPGDEVYFLLFGDTDIIFDGRKLTMRSAPNQVGEMSAMEPGQPRTATVRVRSKTAKAWRITGAVFREIQGAFPRFTERLQLEMSSRHRERIVAGKIAAENHSVSWFCLSLAAAAVAGVVTLFALHYTGWTMHARSVAAAGAAIFLFVLMLLHNPAFFWRRCFAVALLGMIGMITLDHYIAFEAVHGFGKLQVNVLPDGAEADWKLTALRVLPFLVAMSLCAIKDRLHTKG